MQGRKRTCLYVIASSFRLLPLRREMVIVPSINSRSPSSPSHVRVPTARLVCMVEPLQVSRPGACVHSFVSFSHLSIEEKKVISPTQGFFILRCLLEFCVIPIDVFVMTRPSKIMSTSQVIFFVILDTPAAGKGGHINWPTRRVENWPTPRYENWPTPGLKIGLHFFLTYENWPTKNLKLAYTKFNVGQLQF